MNLDFRIGDRVRLDEAEIDRIDQNPDLPPDSTGVVVDINDGDYSDIGVRWDLSEPSSWCHSCSGNCEDGYGWYVPADALLHEEEKEMAVVDSAALLSILMGGDDVCM